MAKTAGLYLSSYGSAKQYAQWIAAALGADLIGISKKMPDISGYEDVILGSGIYAGKISCMDYARKNWRELRDKRLILFTVGLTPLQDEDYYRKLLDSNFTPEMYARIRAFHFAGAMDFQALSPLHRAVMSVMRFALGRKKPDSLSLSERTLLGVLRKTTSCVEEEAIEPLLSYVCGRNQ